MKDNQHEPQTPPPMDDKEFDAWWPFNDDNLDEFEREIEESLKDYEILPDPNWEEKKRRIQEMARRARGSAYPARLTEEQQKLFPPGLLAYWRGEASTPYDDPTAWDEFAKTLAPCDDSGRLVPMDPNGNQETPRDNEPRSDDDAG